MWVSELAEFGPPETAVRLAERPDPGDPGVDEVVIAAELAPINPADLLNIEGKYGAEQPRLPLVPGVEGVGRVVQCGADVTQVKVGDRVLLPGPGTWRERFRVSATGLFPLPEGIDSQQLSMLRVNPPTAYLMLHEYVEPRPGHWVIQNAANSGVGQCLIRLAREAGMKSVNVVRRPELVAPLRELGGAVVLVDGPDLDARVREAIGDGTMRLAIDAVGGSATQRLARCVQDDGVVVNYGVLSGEPCLVDGRETVFRNVSLHGFWLRRWFMAMPPQKIAEVYHMLAVKLLDGTLTVDVEKVYPFRDIGQALAHAARPGRAGKILLSFET
ncbi:MAG: zinc-dependent alcohol dehydrogenase family protein, partial [Arenicellales bacterium]